MPNGAMWSMVTDTVVEIARTLSDDGWIERFPLFKGEVILRKHGLLTLFCDNRESKR